MRPKVAIQVDQSFCQQLSTYVVPSMLTPSPGQPSRLEHLHDFHLRQVRGCSSKAAPRLDTLGKAELGSGIPMPSPFSRELPVAALPRVTASVLPLL